MDLRHLATAAMTIGLSIIIITVVAMILNGLQGTQCANMGGTFGTFIENDSWSGGWNSYNMKTGCCISFYDTYNASTCDNASFLFTKGLNITTKGLSGMETFGNWIPMIVIAVVASIVVGILFSYFIMGIGGGGRRRSRG